MIRDPEWSQWSDREIGRRCGVDGKTVTAIRQNLSAEIPQMPKPSDVIRESTETDGGTKPAEKVIAG